MNTFMNLTISAAVASLAAFGSSSADSSPSEFDINDQYWSKNHTNNGAPYVSIGSNNSHGVTLALAVSHGSSCTQPQVRILEMDSKDFAQVSTSYNKEIRGAKFRVDKGSIWDYEGQGGSGGQGNYTYSDGVFMFMSNHDIASEDFFEEFITGKTMYYTDASLDDTYHFSLNGSAAAYGWFIQECNKFKADTGNQDDADIWGETTKVKRPGYDGQEWES